jgi:3-oxoacyl-[acyl-carrier protein] reductase
MKRHDGKVAVITGASSGIGKAIAVAFAAEGARVMIAARRHKLLDQLAARIEKAGGEAHATVADVDEEADVERLFAEAVRRWRRVDIAVNNAGIIGGGRIASTKTADFDAVIRTNLRGTFLCSRAAVQHMKKQNAGLIINMSSIAGVQGWAGTGAYSASKFGIMGLTKSLADEARAHGIRVTALCPGAVADELVDAPAADILASGKISPFDVAETCIFLATLSPNTVIPEIILNRIGADW